jgi:hypothetical protein
MKTISNPREMMCGAYILEMANPDEASRIISKFSGCPNWPVITKGPKENEVFILAIELKRQCHGDFSEDNNSLVKIPELIGAKRIRFIRIQNWGNLLGGHHFKTGYSHGVPCGSACGKCPLFQSPCQGCPAVFEI